MFHRVSNASTIALVTLAQSLTEWDFDLIDCQVATDHMMRLGAREISRSRFLHELDESLKKKTRRGKWSSV
jgi:leucyl/phenylalanyl-tRNA--protein transferase